MFDSYYSFSTVGFALFIGAALTITAMILSYLFIIPEKRRERLNKVGAFLHDAFNFKFLILEKIFKFLYVLTTIACICGGLSMIFAIEISSGFFTTYSRWYGIYGILIAIIGPVVIRIVYEGLMMFVLLVKNVIEINKKLEEKSTKEETEEPLAKEAIALLKAAEEAPVCKMPEFKPEEEIGE